MQIHVFICCDVRLGMEKLNLRGVSHHWNSGCTFFTHKKEKNNFQFRVQKREKIKQSYCFRKKKCQHPFKDEVVDKLKQSIC